MWYLFALDILFHVLHLSLIFFNLFGWIWKRTRRLHLATISLTLLSWFGLGLYFGMGYCFLTDWHWDVKRALGEQSIPSSYIEYLVSPTGVSSFYRDIIDLVTMVSALTAFIISITLNFRRVKPRKDSSRINS